MVDRKQKPIIIGCTEPSFFTNDVIRMIEVFFQANPIKLCHNDDGNTKFWLDQCDGVILAGGRDIHPRCYGASIMNDYGFNKFDVERDYRELKIINYCFKKKKPMFGICRGHQMLGIRNRIRFIPDLSSGVICHQPMSAAISHAPNEPMHWVQVFDEKFVAKDDPAKTLPHPRASEKKWLWVNSFHHQGLLYEELDHKEVEVLGITQGTRKHQIIELMRGKNNPWLSCQWHPEYDWEHNVASKMVLTHFRDMITKSSPDKPKKRRVQPKNKN